MAVTTLKSLILAGLLTGCVAGTNGKPVSTEPQAGTAGAADTSSTAPITQATSVKLVDHDVEAPKDFQVTDKALWDGRPSLGGVWVAAVGVKDPMRVIMRNPANGKFVIGALFRREADNPGPKLQISSDAADALGLVAGQPAVINVTALRREEVAAPAPSATKPLLDTSQTVQPAPIAEVTTTATAAIDKTTGKPAAKPAIQPAAKPGVLPTIQPPAKPVVQPAIKPAAATAALPVVAAPAVPVAPAAGGASIQIGIFSVEDNAKRAVAALTKIGIVATIRPETSHGKPLWSVLASGDAAVLARVKKAGFADAYFLKR